MKTSERVKIYFSSPSEEVCIEFPTPDKTNYVVWVGTTGYGKNSLKECLDYLLEKYPTVPIKVKDLYITTTTIIDSND